MRRAKVSGTWVLAENLDDLDEMGGNCDMGAGPLDLVVLERLDVPDATPAPITPPRAGPGGTYPVLPCQSASQSVRLCE